MFPVHQDPSNAKTPCPSNTAFFCTLDDTELLAEVNHLAARERHATADLIAALMEVDRRRLYLGEGCSSLYTYCTQILHLSEHAAYGRIQAARAASRIPAILPLLMNGSISLTTIILLAPHLTQENHEPLLAAACYKSKRHVEQLIARLYPQPDIPSCIRALAGSECFGCQRQFTGQAVEEDAGLDLSKSTENDNTPMALSGHGSRSALSASAAVWALSAERFRVQMTIGRDALDQLRAVQDLLRHTIPNGDVAAIFERALALLHRELMRRKAATTSRPRPAESAASAQDGTAPADDVPVSADGSDAAAATAACSASEGSTRAATSRHIPAAVRREVWARDHGQCAFVGSRGRCAETGFLEFHHLRPYAVGGEATVQNIELRCRPHNVHEAERYFGAIEPGAGEPSGTSATDASDG